MQLSELDRIHPAWLWKLQQAAHFFETVGLFEVLQVILTLHPLSRRLEDLKKSEQRATLEDLMYASVLEKFLELGLQMLPRMDSVLDTPTNLKALTEGLHSKEALEHVREHVRQCLGPASSAFSNTMLKMSKLQGAQVTQRWPRLEQSCTSCCACAS